MAQVSKEVEEALGAVVRSLPAGELRPGQVEMAKAVRAVLSAGHPRHLSVNAGTGTGKSFGYLVPAVLSRRRTVVATATIALQDQLARKDLPAVASGLGRAVSVAVLKGRSNYLCRQRLIEIERLGEQERLDLGNTAPRRSSRSGALERGDEVARLVAWSKETACGDRSMLSFEPSAGSWAAVTVSADECPGAARCPSGADCFAELARARAADADVVVVNQHLLGAHLRSGGAILPDFEALVVDEAHELEDVLSSSLGADVSAGRLRGVAAAARAALVAAGRDGGVADGVVDVAAVLESALHAASRQRLGQGLGSGLGDVVTLVVSRLGRLEEVLRSPAGDGGGEHVQRLARSLLAVGRCREDLQHCLDADDDTVVFVEGDDRPRLRSAPLDVSGPLREHVFSSVPVVLTSATIAPGLAARLGAPPADVTELDAGSPFDFRANALLYCAAALPDRRRPEAEPRLFDELANLVLAAGGRTLALFTSRRVMAAAAAALRERLPWPVHVQGDLPKPALLEAFSSEEVSCLFATMGYWQGVDVPGPSLCLVAIDRIPFPRPDDPLLSARRDAAGEGGFRAVDLPRAATLLAQGAGRLIRTSSDRGVVAVLDPRLATAPYSGYLVAALPPMRRTRERSVAVEFLGSIAGGSPPPPMEPTPSG